MTLHLVIDCETTGLFDYGKEAHEDGQPRLCQIGMIQLDEGFNTIREVEYLIRPNGWQLTPEAAEVNGLTQELLEAEGTDIRIPLRHYTDAVDNKHVVVAFNAPFDLKLLRGELRRQGWADRYMQTRHMCIMQGCRSLVDARTEMGRKKPPSLEEACKHFEVALEPVPHRALGGARAALEILRKLREKGMMPAYKDPYDRTKYK